MYIYIYITSYIYIYIHTHIVKNTGEQRLRSALVISIRTIRIEVLESHIRIQSRSIVNHHLSQEMYAFKN